MFIDGWFCGVRLQTGFLLRFVLGYLKVPLQNSFIQGRLPVILWNVCELLQIKSNPGSRDGILARNPPDHPDCLDQINDWYCCNKTATGVTLYPQVDLGQSVTGSGWGTEGLWIQNIRTPGNFLVWNAKKLENLLEIPSCYIKVS